MQELGLDAAFPPSAYQWVADMNAVGASVGIVYVYGPYLNYTVGHISIARQAGKSILPVVVPGNGAPPYAAILAALRSYGIHGGPVVVDLEQFSEPSDDWVRGLHTFLDAYGFLVERYGTTSELGRYSPEEGDWIAEWIRTGVLNPIPTLRAGRLAWQFVNDITINGSTYDASVIDSSFLGGFMPLDASDPIVAELRHTLAGTYWLSATGGAVDGDPNGATPPEHHRFDFGSMIADIQNKVSALATGGLTADAVAAALASHPLVASLAPGSADDIAAHVMAHLSHDTSAG